MTPADPHAHPAAIPTIAPPSFSPEEVAKLQRDDRWAATLVVGIMIGIFTLGLVGYLIIAYICA